MSRYKDIDLCAKIIKKEFSYIKSSGVSMYKKGRRDGLVLANAILNDDKRVHPADVVEVVRCKDCKYYQDNNDGYPHDECKWCKDETPNADDFCSYGERKDENV